MKRRNARGGVVKAVRSRLPPNRPIIRDPAGCGRFIFTRSHVFNSLVFRAFRNFPPPCIFIRHIAFNNRHAADKQMQIERKFRQHRANIRAFTPIFSVSASLSVYSYASSFISLLFLLSQTLVEYSMIIFADATSRIFRTNFPICISCRLSRRWSKLN